MDAVTPVLSNALPELRRIYRVDIQRAVPAVPTLDRRSRWQEDHRSGQSQGRAEKSGGTLKGEVPKGSCPFAKASES